MLQHDATAAPMFGAPRNPRFPEGYGKPCRKLFGLGEICLGAGGKGSAGDWRDTLVRHHSFALIDQIEEIKTGFLFLDMILAAVGMIDEGTFAAVELRTAEPAVSSAFYGELLGWTLEGDPEASAVQRRHLDSWLRPGGGE